MKKTALSILFLLTFIYARCQDTIVKRNGDVVIAKILEINPAEVKYKRSDIPDGPLYTENKLNIEMIRFSNGVKEVFKQEVPIAPPVITLQSPGSYYQVPANTNYIDVYGNNYIYHHSRIDERSVQDLLLATKDKRIESLVAQAKDAKSLQNVGFAAIPLGIATYFFFLKSTGIFNFSHNSYSSGSNRNTNFLGLNKTDFTISGICLVGTIACPIVSGVFKSNRKKYNHAAINLYNEKF